MNLVSPYSKFNDCLNELVGCNSDIGKCLVQETVGNCLFFHCVLLLTVSRPMDDTIRV